MKVRFASKNHTSHCGTAAAVCSSAHMIPILDTAKALVVSICVCLLPLRVCSL